jgi:hypothetical protein
MLGREMLVAVDDRHLREGGDKLIDEGRAGHGRDLLV